MIHIVTSGPIIAKRAKWFNIFCMGTNVRWPTEPEIDMVNPISIMGPYIWVIGLGLEMGL